MALARLQAKTGVNTTFASSVSSAAFTSPLTNPSIIMVAVEIDTGAANSANTPTDTAGNTYTRVLSKSVLATFDLEIWYALNTSTTASNVVTVTDTAGGVDSIIAVEEWSGHATVTPTDGSSSNSGTGSANTSGNVTTVAPVDVLWVAGVEALGSNGYSLGSGYSNLTQDSTTFSNLAIESQVVSSVGTYNGALTGGVGVSWACGMVAIRQKWPANYDFESAPAFTAAQTADNWINGAAAGSTTNNFGWWASPRATAIAVKFDSSLARSGTNSLKVSTTNTTGRARVFNVIASSGNITATSANAPYLISVLPNTTYTFTAWAQTNNAASGSVFIEMVELNSSFAVGTSTPSNTLSGTNASWTLLTATVTTAASTIYMALDMQNATAGNVSDAWFDDLTFAGPATAPANYATTRIANRNVGPMAMRRRFKQPYYPVYLDAPAANVTVTPGVATLVLATFAPVLQSTIITGLATLTLTTFAPSIVLGTIVTPGVVALTLTTFAPTVSVSDNKTVTPSTLALSLTTYAPTIVLPRTVTPSTLALILTTYAPTVTATSNQVVTPDTLVLVLTTYAPTAAVSFTYTPLRSTISGAAKAGDLVGGQATARIDGADHTTPLDAAQNTGILSSNSTNATVSGSNNESSLS